jgi:glutathione peroxidase-family protein
LGHPGTSLKVAPKINIRFKITYTEFAKMKVKGKAAMTIYGGMEAELHAFLASGLDGDNGNA